MGLDVYLTKGVAATEDEGYESRKARRIEIDSAQFPKHYFKIGCWRSSYNEEGINSVLRTFFMPSLWHLYSAAGDAVYKAEFDEVLSWGERLKRARQMLDEFKNAVILANGVFVVSIRDRDYLRDDGPNNPDNPGQALAIYMAERAKYAEHPGFGTYTSKAGDFWLDYPLKVRAIIGGTVEYGAKTNYAIAESEPDHYDWYIQALMIVVETCEWVLAQENPEQYNLEYSG